MMNFFIKAYRDDHLIFGNHRDVDTQYNYMVSFCYVSSTTMDGRLWAVLNDDGTFIFQDRTSFRRKGYKQFWIAAKVLPAEEGCVVAVVSKISILSLLPFIIAPVVIGLFLLCLLAFDMNPFNWNALFAALLFLVIVPIATALSISSEKKYLLKKFTKQFDLVLLSDDRT